MNQLGSLSRRKFLAATSCFGAALALARTLPLPALADALVQDPRVSDVPLLDKGFAAVHQIGDGVYATISDISKGLDTLSNGGFLVGREAALLIEGHCTPTGAAFELEALRRVSQLPVRAALDTHYHFDHSLGNTAYGAQGIPIWAHANAAPMIVERYAKLQGQDKTPIFEPLEKRVRDAADETERQHAESDLNAYKLIFGAIDATVLALPSLPLDPASLPLTVDLGGLQAVIETYPGHTPTDIIVRVPEQNIVFTGDLLFNGWYPATLDAEMSAWRATLEQFAAFDEDTLFVPGHGQLCGQDGIAEQRALFDHLYQHAWKSFEAGLPVAEAQRRYTVPEPFAAFTLLSWGLMIDSAMAKFYDEFAQASP